MGFLGSVKNSYRDPLGFLEDSLGSILDYYWDSLGSLEDPFELLFIHIGILWDPSMGFLGSVKDSN